MHVTSYPISWIIYMDYDLKLRQTVGIPICINCAPFVAGLF